jgi:hypothetical protein
VLLDLEKIRRSDPCCMGGAALELEVDGAIQMARGLTEGIALKTSTIERCNSFYKDCVKRFENFLRVDVMMTQHGIPGSEKKVTFYGQKAIEWQMANVSTKMKSCSEVTLGDLKVFRTYDWLLTCPQKDLRDRWFTDLLQSVRDIKPISDDCSKGSMHASGDKLDVVAAGSSSSSSSTAPAALSSLALIKQKDVVLHAKPVKVKAAPLMVGSVENLMKFFVPKKLS